ncbi:hypothetical protein [Vibrio neonatus]|uniref:hypothetical protein n=1 Tax=Vibrio neonatus TaxID=278860 RepID=UPI0039F11661
MAITVAFDIATQSKVAINKVAISKVAMVAIQKFAKSASFYVADVSTYLQHYAGRVCQL